MAPGAELRGEGRATAKQKTSRHREEIHWQARPPEGRLKFSSLPGNLVACGRKGATAR